MTEYKLLEAGDYVPAARKHHRRRSQGRQHLSQNQPQQQQPTDDDQSSDDFLHPRADADADTPLQNAHSALWMNIKERHRAPDDNLDGSLNNTKNRRGLAGLGVARGTDGTGLSHITHAQNDVLSKAERKLYGTRRQQQKQLSQHDGTKPSGADGPRQNGYRRRSSTTTTATTSPDSGNPQRPRRGSLSLGPTPPDMPLHRPRGGSYMVSEVSLPLLPQVEVLDMGQSSTSLGVSATGDPGLIPILSPAPTPTHRQGRGFRKMGSPRGASAADTSGDSSGNEAGDGKGRRRSNQSKHNSSSVVFQGSWDKDDGIWHGGFHRQANQSIGSSVCSEGGLVWARPSPPEALLRASVDNDNDDAAGNMGDGQIDISTGAKPPVWAVSGLPPRPRAQPRSSSSPPPSRSHHRRDSDTHGQRPYVSHSVERTHHDEDDDSSDADADVYSSQPIDRVVSKYDPENFSQTVDDVLSKFGGSSGRSGSRSSSHHHREPNRAQNSQKHMRNGPERGGHPTSFYQANPHDTGGTMYNNNNNYNNINNSYDRSAVPQQLPSVHSPFVPAPPPPHNPQEYPSLSHKNSSNNYHPYSSDDRVDAVLADHGAGLHRLSRPVSNQSSLDRAGPPQRRRSTIEPVPGIHPAAGSYVEFFSHLVEEKEVFFAPRRHPRNLAPPSHGPSHTNNENGSGGGREGHSNSRSSSSRSTRNGGDIPVAVLVIPPAPHPPKAHPSASAFDGPGTQQQQQQMSHHMSGGHTPPRAATISKSAGQRRMSDLVAPPSEEDDGAGRGSRQETPARRKKSRNARSTGQQPRKTTTNGVVTSSAPARTKPKRAKSQKRGREARDGGGGSARSPSIKTGAAAKDYTQNKDEYAHLLSRHGFWGEAMARLNS